MYRIYDYHDYSWGHRQIWETCGIEHAIFARNYNDGWSDFELYTANGKLSSLTTTAKDNLVSAVNEVKYKIEIIQGIEVDTEGDLVTPIKIGKSIPFMFESTDRLGWKHIFIKNVNKSSDYWILNSYGTTGPMTGSISGKIYYFQV